MVNPFKEINWRPDMADRRIFARSLVIGFPCVAVVLLVAIRLRTGAWDFETPLWVGGVGAVLGVLLYFVPAIARPFYAAWFALACSIGLVVGNLLLALVFYVVVTPIGLIKRAVGNRSVRKKFDKSAATYWVDVEKPSGPDRYFSQF